MLNADNAHHQDTTERLLNDTDIVLPIDSKNDLKKYSELDIHEMCCKNFAKFVCFWSQNNSSPLIKASTYTSGYEHTEIKKSAAVKYAKRLKIRGGTITNKAGKSDQHIVPMPHTHPERRRYALDRRGAAILHVAIRPPTANHCRDDTTRKLQTPCYHIKTNTSAYKFFHSKPSHLTFQFVGNRYADYCYQTQKVTSL